MPVAAAPGRRWRRWSAGAGRTSATRSACRRRLAGHVYEYRTGWVDGAPSTEHLPRLAEDVYQALEQVILDELGKMRGAGPLDEETESHRRFGRDILTPPGATPTVGGGTPQSAFVDRDHELRRIAAYLAGDDPVPFAVFAPGGSGKSTLLAQAAELAQEGWPHAAVVARFIGASAGSAEAGSSCTACAGSWLGSSAKMRRQSRTAS